MGLLLRCGGATKANERREKKASSSRGELYTLMTVTAIGSAMNGKALLAHARCGERREQRKQSREGIIWSFRGEQRYSQRRW